MGKTAEQKAADQALDEAVRQVVEAYKQIPEGHVVVDYVVIGEAGRFMADGDSNCEMFLQFKDGFGRLTTVLGMIELGRKHLLGMYTSDGGEEP